MKYVRVEKIGGNMRLILLPEAREDAEELRAAEERGEKSCSDIEADILEDLIANSWTYVQPEDVGALTSAPMITEDFECNDEGDIRPVVGGYVYAFMDYQVYSILDRLLDSGEATFIGSIVEAKATS